jgi:hypothetical protein
MRVFHHSSYQYADVDADAAVERSLEQALCLFAGIRREGSFLGICLDERHVLQFQYEQAAFRTEILDTQSRTVEHCMLSCPLAEEVIRQAYIGGDFRRVPSESFIRWQHESLSPDGAA